MAVDFNNGGRLIETADELPRIPAHIEKLYLDFETSSNDPTKKSLDPWDVAHCTVIGAAVTWDDCPRAFFVRRDLLLTGWLFDLMSVSDAWVNHNVKYDAHVCLNDLGLEFTGPLICTIALAKIFDADRTYKGGYGLDVLSKQLLLKDIDEHHQRMIPYLAGKKNKDYGWVPIDFLAEYACQDALTERELYHWLLEQLPEDSAWVQQNEIKLTSSLIAMERHGLYIDPLQVKYQQALDTHHMLTKMTEIKEAVGYEVDPQSYDAVYDLLINRYCFPIIFKERKSQSEAPTASFDKHVLKQYSQMGAHFAPYSEVIKMILSFRNAAQRCSLFWTPWLQFADEHGVFHSSYNQNVRSGRTSCKWPNAQQLDFQAKLQVRARPGRRLLCWDYSQLEYRWMIHYLQNPAGLKAFNENPHVDFHQWVADVLCGGIPRKPAKTMNFRIGFGGGKAGVVAALSIEPHIIEVTGGDPDLVRLEGLRVYNLYHRNLPELKQHSRMAANAALKYGFVQTLYGRRLHLPAEFAHKGFNRVIQSTAADNAKEATNDVSSAHNELLRSLDVHLCAQVHDEYLFDMPDDDEAIALASTEITRCLEAPSRRCRVPIIADLAVKSGASNWAHAKEG
jgi:DNA polymerase-1